MLFIVVVEFFVLFYKFGRMFRFFITEGGGDACLIG